MSDLIPTKEQYNQWKSNWSAIRADKRDDIGCYLVTRAAQWGADQELEECATLMPTESMEKYLRTARRPKPPSLKKEGLESLDKILQLWMTNEFSKEEFVEYGTNVRKALEALPND
jgi:hypothetical protein